MGSLLVIPEGEAAFGRVQAFDIVDGQQRLTTFHLCYAAMRDVALRRGFDDLYRKFESLLFQGEGEEVDEKYGRYKLQPTEFDRDLFRQIVDLKSEELRLEHPNLFHKNGKYMKGKVPAIGSLVDVLLPRELRTLSLPTNSRLERGSSRSRMSSSRTSGLSSSRFPKKTMLRSFSKL